MTETQGRVLGLDFGAKTVGVAVCDPMRLTVRSLEIIRRKDESHLRPTLRRIVELAAEYDVRELVLGLPLNMDGSAGPRAELTLSFRDMLQQRLDLPVHMQDERLTSVEAEERMAEAGIQQKHFKDYVDQVAAAIILQDWLNEHGND